MAVPVGMQAPIYAIYLAARYAGSVFCSVLLVIYLWLAGK
jgi:hypothetical protein